MTFLNIFEHKTPLKFVLSLNVPVPQALAVHQVKDVKLPRSSFTLSSQQGVTTGLLLSSLQNMSTFLNHCLFKSSGVPHLCGLTVVLPKDWRDARGLLKDHPTSKADPNSERHRHAKPTPRPPGLRLLWILFFGIFFFEGGGVILFDTNFSTMCPQETCGSEWVQG